jgi:hypothetical protein
VANTTTAKEHAYKHTLMKDAADSYPNNKAVRYQKPVILIFTAVRMPELM